jgi:uncharacterized protein YdeI (YjbR/CyaY-like superfamily)
MNSNKDVLTQEVIVFKLSDFTKWLEKNHIKESKVSVIRYKKHTGKSSPSSQELMHEAICYGWIDTTAHRVDQDKYKVIYSKRTKNSRWSNNTIEYAKKLIRDKRMKKQGLEFYLQGLRKPTHDFGIPANPDMPKELKIELNKAENKQLNLPKKFDLICASKKKMYYRSILRAKLSETKKKRINEIIEMLKIN